MPRLWMLAVLALAGVVPDQTPVEKPLPLDVGGRVVTDPDGAKRFGWPGTYFEGRFEGAAVTVSAEARDEQLAVLIDGKQSVVLTKDSPIHIVIGGLERRTHVVRLEKRTESQAGSARFLGFSAPGGHALPPRPRRRRIEFIGDSHSAGYGNTSPTRECTREQVHDTTNTQLAFGPLLAKKLDADYRVIAYSGFGIVRRTRAGLPRSC